LFLLYINDICNAIPDAKIKLFADDSNLFLYDTSLSNLHHRATLSLTCLSKWFLANRLSLSIDKMCYSIFGNQHNDSFTPNLQVEIMVKQYKKLNVANISVYTLIIIFHGENTPITFIRK